MKSVNSTLALALLVFGFTNAIQAQSNRTSQQIRVAVAEVDVFSCLGKVSLTFPQTSSGSGIESATGTATWFVSTNGNNRKITAELDSDLPEGLDLKIGMEAPIGVKSTGMKSLSAQPTRLIQNLTNSRQSGMTISYMATATTHVLSNSYHRTVIFTITMN